MRGVQPRSSPVGSAVTRLSNFEGGYVTRTGRGFGDVAFSDSGTKRKSFRVATKVQTRFYDVQVYKESNATPLIKHALPEDM